MADYLERMKEKKSENPYLQRMREKNAQNALNEIQSGLANMSSIASTLYTDTYERYKSGNDTYRTDSKDWLNKTSSASSNFQAGYNRVNQLLDNYKGIFDENWANDIRNALSSYSENIKKITDNARQEDSFWSQFDTEDYYNEWKTKSSADLDALGKEISDLEATYEKARTYSRSRVSPTYWGKLLSDAGYSGDANGLEQMRKDIQEKKAFRDDASRYQYQSDEEKKVMYADFLKMVEDAKASPDFEKYSAEGEALENPTYTGSTFALNNWFPKPIQNPVTFVRDTFEDFSAQPEYAPKGYEPNYRFLNEDQVSAYNYYLAAEKAGLVEKGTADKFLETATNYLNEKEGKDLITRLPDNIIGDLLVGMYAGGEQFNAGMEGVGRLFEDLANGSNFSDAPISSGEFALSAWQQNLPDNFGGKIRKGVTDLTSTITNQVPSIMASTILSNINPDLGQNVGAITMGVGAAGNAYNQMVRDGYTTEQARMKAVIIGISETCLEKAIGGIAAFGGGGAKLSKRIVEQICKGVDSAAQRAAIQFGGKILAEMASEGVEEFVQDVLEPYYDALITGATPEDIDWEQAAYSGLLGALSAGVLNGTTGVARQIQTSATARNINGASLKNVVIENFGEDSLARQYAQELGDNPTTFQKARLLYEIENNFNEDMESDLADEIIKQGVDVKTAHKTAQEIVDALTSGRNIDITDENIANAFNAMSDSILQRLYAKNTIDELAFAGNIDAETIAPTLLMRNTNTAYDIAQSIRAEGAFVTDAFAQEIKDNLVNAGTLEADADTMVRSFKESTVKDIPEYKDALSNPVLTEAVKNALRGNTTESEMIKADVDKAEAPKTEETKAPVKETKPVEETAPVENTKNPNAVKKLIAELKIPSAYENAIRAKYESLNELDGKAYLAGIRNAYNYGLVNSSVATDEFVEKLSDTERETFFNEGRKASKAREQAEQEMLTANAPEPVTKSTKKLTATQLKKKRESLAKKILKRGAKRNPELEKAFVVDGKQYISDSYMLIVMDEGNHLDVPTWNNEYAEMGERLKKIFDDSKSSTNASFSIEENYEDADTIREYAKTSKEFPYTPKDHSRSFNPSYLADTMEFVPDATEYRYNSKNKYRSAVIAESDGASVLLLPVRMSGIEGSDQGRWQTEHFLEEAKQKANENAIKKPKGSVRGYNISVKELQEGFNENQKTAYRNMVAIAQARNINLVLFDSRKSVPPELKGSNGAYSPSTRTMYIDISAGVGANDVGNLADYTLLQTFSHEFVHVLENDNAKAYNEFRSFILDKMSERGYSINDLIEAKQGLYGDIDYDAASREVIAESMVNILSEEAVLKDLYDNHLNIFQKIYKALVDFVNDLKAYFEKTFAHGTTDEAKTIMDGIHYVEGVTDAFRKLMNAEPQLQKELNENAPAENNEATIATIEGTEDGVPKANAYTSNLKGTMQFSKNTEEDAYIKVVMPLSDEGTQKVITQKDVPGGKMVYDPNTRTNDYALTGRQVREYTMGENGFTEEQISNVTEFMKAMSKFYKDMGIRYTFIGLQDVENAKLSYTYNAEGKKTGVVLSAMVKNNEYPVNFDLSTICKKRKGVSELIEKLGSAIDSKNKTVDLTPENLFKINEALKDAGYETACLGCFVESKRYTVMKWASEICEAWNEAVLKVNPNATYFGYSQGNVDEISIDRILEFDKEAQKFANSPAAKGKDTIAKLVNSGENYQRLLRPSDLITAKGMAQLRKLPNFFGVMYQQYGTGTPKPIQGFTPYNSEIALLPSKKGSMSLKDYLIHIAGVRMQSFSDSQIQNLYDYLQMIGDLAARKLPAHAYTKEISFAKLLGMTGLKTNLSVMFDIDASLVEKVGIKAAREHAGLTLYDPNVHTGEYKRVVLKDEYGEWVYNVGDYAMQKAYKNAYPERKRRFVQSIGFAEAVALQTSEGYTQNCGIIGVGYSNLHILAMLDDNRIRYIIPYHASSLPGIIKDVTNISYATDYSKRQNTVKITSLKDKNGNAVKWTLEEAIKRTGSAAAAIRELNAHIENDGWKIQIAKAESGHGDFNLYEDLAKTKDPRKTASNYIEWCGQQGYLPVFFDFANHDNYYKLVYDFNVYDTVTEEYAPFEAVQNIYPARVGDGIVPRDIADGGFDTSYMEETIEKQMAFMDDYNRRQDLATTNLAENIVNNNRYEITLPNDLQRQLRQMDTEYLELAKDPEKNEAKLDKMVEEAAREAGYDSPKLYHGTMPHDGKGGFGFTKFDLSKMDDGSTIFLTDNDYVAESYAGTLNKRTISGKQFDASKATDEEIIKKYNELNDHSDEARVLTAREISDLRKEYEGSIQKYARDIDALYSASQNELIKETYRLTQDDFDAIKLLKENANDYVNAKTPQALEEADEEHRNILKKSSKSLQKYYWVMTAFGEGVANAPRQLAQLNRLAESNEKTVMIGRGGFARTIDYLRNSVADKLASEGDKGIYSLYAKTEGLLRVDGAERNWDELRLPKALRTYATKDHALVYTTREIVALAKQAGYRGVIFEDVVDVGAEAWDYYASDVYALFNPEDIKSADPVTYDSNGNVIPLSERFNPVADDLRYQRKVQEIPFDDYEKMEKNFGTTNNFDIAGYLLRDGKMLDFSGRHWNSGKERYRPAEGRYADHRDIGEFLADRESGTDAMIDMIGNGNIRLMPEVGGINLAVKPNGLQTQVLRNYIRHFGGEVIVDFDAAGGDTVFSKEYDKGTSPEQVLNDIEDYFNGKLRPRSELMMFHQRKNEYRLGDWEILSRAANNVNSSNYTDEEKSALNNFKNRLSILQNLQEKREELGTKYHDQAFTKEGDKKLARQTLAQMHQYDDKINKAITEIRKVTDTKVVRDVLKRSREVVEAQERQHGQELLQRYRDRRDNSEAIAKYKKKVLKESKELQKWLLNPNDKAAKRVPDVLRNSVVNFLTLIDETSARALKGGEATQADYKFAARLKELQSAFRNNIKAEDLYSGYSDLPDTFFEELQEIVDIVDSLTARTDTFVLNAMTSVELKKLSLTLTAIKKYIQNMNAFLSNAMYAHAYEAGNDTIGYLSGLNKSGLTERGLFNYFTWTQMRPAYVWSRFGKGGEAMYDELRRAQGKMAFNVAEVIDFTRKLYTSKEVKKWQDELVKVKIGNDEAEVPLTYLMSLRELWKQEDSKRHILGKGLRFATFTRKLRKIMDTGHRIGSNEVDEILKIFDKPEYKRAGEVADELQKYMATQGAEWGNYVSRIRFGREAFTNPQYFSISSDGRHLEATADEKPNNSNLYALLNMSFTKEREEHANNRLMVYDIFDVFANHMSSMAQYNAFALPILDTLKWLNYETEDETGKPISVKDEMSRVFGAPTEKSGRDSASYAETFVKNIIKAFNGTESQMNPTDEVGLGFLRRYNMAQIAFNLRVAVQQPMAIVRAASILKGTTLLKGALLNMKNLKANIAEMQKYSGIAKWKDLGYYDTNASRGLTQQIKHDENFLEKFGEAGMIPAEFLDNVTWASIWVASKEEAKSQGYSGEELLMKAADIFENVIYKTQVVDSVLTKTEYMRNKGAIARILSSFMSEPVTTASMVVDALEQVNLDRRRGYTPQELFKRHGSNLARVTAVYCVNAIVLAAVEAAIDSLRDDKDDPDKYGKKFWSNFWEEMSPFGKYPIIKDIEEMAQGFAKIFGYDTYGYSPRTITGQGVDQFLKGTQIIVDKINGQKKGYTWYAGIQKLLQGISGLTGMHFGAITRELITTWNTVVGSMNPNLKVRNYVSNDDLSKMIATAAEKGDNEALQDLESKYYKDEDSFKTAYKDAIGDRFIAGEISQEQAIRLLERYYSKDDAYWQVDRWKYKESNGTAEGYGKYNDFYTAVETGKNLKSVIKTYTENGVDKKTLASQITSHFKPIYVNASKAEKARLKGYLLNAYELLGYNRKDKSKDIDAWG